MVCHLPNCFWCCKVGSEDKEMVAEGSPSEVRLGDWLSKYELGCIIDSYRWSAACDFKVLIKLLRVWQQLEVED